MVYRSATAPEFLPVLSAGRHRHPRDGACLMEFASILAGEPWSDHPRCTAPVLSEVARQVNDAVGEHTRQRLLSLIPGLVGAASRDPALTAALAHECASRALALVPTHHRLLSGDGEALHRLARRPKSWRGAARGLWLRATAQDFARLTAMTIVDDSVAVLWSSGDDEALYELLTACVRCYHRARSGSGPDADASTREGVGLSAAIDRGDS